MISEWKKYSQKFTKYLFMEDTKCSDGTEYLQRYIYKRILNKNKKRIVKFEAFLWANDFFFKKN